MKTTINQYIIVIVTFISSLFVTSCEKEIELNLRTAPPVVVIEGKLQEKEKAQIKVTMTKGYYENNEFSPVTGAVVKIQDDAGNNETLTFDSSKGLYVSNIISGVVGRTYNLSVSYEGKEYTSTSKMPALVEADSINFVKFPSSFSDYPLPIICLTDPKGVDNYYRHILYVNGKRPKMEETPTSDEFRDGTVIKRTIPVFPVNDKVDDPIQKGDKIRIETQCIDKGAYHFFETLSHIDDSQNNPTTNIKGGALGYFSAYTTGWIETEVNW